MQSESVTVTGPLTLDLVTRLVEALARTGQLRGQQARAEAQRLIAVLRRSCAPDE